LERLSGLTFPTTSTFFNDYQEFKTLKATKIKKELQQTMALSAESKRKKWLKEALLMP